MDISALKHRQSNSNFGNPADLSKEAYDVTDDDLAFSEDLSLTVELFLQPFFHYFPDEGELNAGFLGFQHFGFK